MRLAAKRTRLIACLAFSQCLTGCTADRISLKEMVVAKPVLANQMAVSDKKQSPITAQPDPLPDTDIRQAVVQVTVIDEAPEGLFSGDKTLTPTRLIALVMERSPTLDQMRATAAAAQARYPQAISLDDPMLNFVTAPGTIGAQNASYAARTELTQKIPFPGKRDLRGQVAQAEANAAVRDVDGARLQLIESSLDAFADYFLTEHALAVNADNLKFLQDFRRNAENRYKNGQVSQQDVLQADVELARQQERNLSLQRARQVAKARLNTLMHLLPDSPLPPPDKAAPLTQTPEPLTLRAMAIDARPDLRALADRIAAEEASVQLAIKEYKPDVELLASYDSFWQGINGHPLQWQVGARVNLPARLARRDAAVIEAQAKVAQRRPNYRA